MHTHPIDELHAYLTQQLDDDARGRVQAHLDDCAQCRDELAFLSALRDGIQAPLPPANELALARLMRDIRAEKNKATPASRWKQAFLAAAAVILVQGVLLTQTWRSHVDAPGYQPLSGDTVDTARIVVRFQPDAREADIRALLRSLDLQLVDGPAASGLYRVQSAGHDSTDAVRRLRLHTDIVAEALAEAGSE